MTMFMFVNQAVICYFGKMVISWGFNGIIFHPLFDRLDKDLVSVQLLRLQFANWKPWSIEIVDLRMKKW